MPAQAPTIATSGYACEVLYLQKEYGVEGLLSYPFSTFSRIDASARLMGVSRTFFDNFAYDRFGSPTANIPAAELNDKWGMIDKIGNWVFKPQFDAIKEMEKSQ